MKNQGKDIQAAKARISSQSLSIRVERLVSHGTANSKNDKPYAITAIVTK